jgi:hypothetical protein
VAYVVVVLAVLKNREIGANTSPAAYCVSGAKGAPPVRREWTESRRDSDLTKQASGIQRRSEKSSRVTELPRLTQASSRPPHVNLPSRRGDSRRCRGRHVRSTRSLGRRAQTPSQDRFRRRVTNRRIGSAANVGVDAHARDGDGDAQQHQHGHHVTNLPRNWVRPNDSAHVSPPTWRAAVTHHLRADRNHRQLTGGQGWPDVTRSDMYRAWSTTRSASIPT